MHSTDPLVQLTLLRCLRTDALMWCTPDALAAQLTPLHSPRPPRSHAGDIYGAGWRVWVAVLRYAGRVMAACRPVLACCCSFRASADSYNWGGSGRMLRGGARSFGGVLSQLETPQGGEAAAVDVEMDGSSSDEEFGADMAGADVPHVALGRPAPAGADSRVLGGSGSCPPLMRAAACWLPRSVCARCAPRGVGAVCNGRTNSILVGSLALSAVLLFTFLVCAYSTAGPVQLSGSLVAGGCSFADNATASLLSSGTRTALANEDRRTVEAVAISFLAFFLCCDLVIFVLPADAGRSSYEVASVVAAARRALNRRSLFRCFKIFRMSFSVGDRKSVV